MTKRLIGLIALVLLFVGFAAVPTSAQCCNGEKFDQVAYLKNIVANLELQPLTNEFCSYYERWRAAEVLFDRLNLNQELQKSVGVSDLGAELAKRTAASELAKKLPRELYGYGLPITCRFQTPLSPGTVEDLSLYTDNVYEVALLLNRLIKESALSYSSKDIPSIEEVNDHLYQQSIKDIQNVRNQWKSGEKGCKESFWIWYLMTDHRFQVSPSIWSLKPQELERIMECHSMPAPGFRKPSS